MKKYLYTFIFLTTLFLGSNVFATGGCSLVAERNPVTKKIMFSLSTNTCANVPTKAPAGYRLVLSDKKFFTEIPKSDNPYSNYHDKNGYTFIWNDDGANHVAYSYIVADAPDILSVSDDKHYDTLPSTLSHYYSGHGVFKTDTVVFKYASLLRYSDTTSSNKWLGLSAETVKMLPATLNSAGGFSVSIDESSISPLINIPITDVAGVSAPTIPFRELTIGVADANGNALATGGINPPNGINGYKYYIQYTKDKTDYTTGKAVNLIEGTSHLRSDGSYSNLIDIFKDPGSVYYVRQAYDDSSGKREYDSDANITQANAVFGNNIKAQAKDLEENAYGLLSSVKGNSINDLTPTIVVADPGSLSCTLAKKISANAICSFSDLLNTFIKYAIGISVVILVISIMMDGFRYMLTDVAGVKASVKGTLMDKGIGLLIALSAYVILNTINPTLLSNTVGMDQVTISMHYNVDSNDYSHGTHGGSSGGRQAKPTTFPNDARKLHDITIAAVNAAGLPSITILDAKRWFPTSTGTFTAEQWTSLIAGIAQAESGFKDSENYTESFQDDTTKSAAVSRGLLQLSVGDCVSYHYNGGSCTSTDLANSEFNIKLGVAILKKWMNKSDSGNNVISKSVGPREQDWRGATKYWSTLRY